MQASTRRRPPATGTARWQHDCPESGNRVLRITVNTRAGRVAADYEVEPVAGGYRLHRLDPRTFAIVTYRIRVDASGCWHCDCPDAGNDPARCNSCKHARGLRAALAAEPF